MGEGEYRSGDVLIRRMRPRGRRSRPRTSPTACSATTARRPRRGPRAPRALRRFARYLELDPGGQWVAEIDGDGGGHARTRSCARGSGASALFAVAPEHQGRGVGRRLLDAALAYGDGARGGWIMSSEDPRRHAPLRAGGLRPAPVRRGRRDAADGSARRARRRVETICATPRPISRAVRGASHGDDLAGLLDGGARCSRSRAASPSTRRAASGCSPRSTTTRRRGSCGRASRGRRAARRCRSTCSPRARTGRSAPAWRPAWRSRRAARSSPGVTSGRCGPTSRRAPGSSRTSAVERRPARIGRALVGVVGAGVVEVLAAVRAQPGAVLAAEELLREREHDGVARPRRDVELLVRSRTGSRARRRRPARRPRGHRRPGAARRRRGTACTARAGSSRCAGAARTPPPTCARCRGSRRRSAGPSSRSAHRTTRRRRRRRPRCGGPLQGGGAVLRDPCLRM